jgi:hypothetical protein
MNIRPRYLFTELASGLTLTHQQKQSICLFHNLIAKDHHLRGQSFTANQHYWISTALTSQKTIANRPAFQNTRKMSALEEDGSGTFAQLALEDKHAGGKKQRGGGGGGRGGRGGGQSREVLVSKALSRLLRHQAENAGVQLDAEGFAALDEVVSVL